MLRADALLRTLGCSGAAAGEGRQSMSQADLARDAREATKRGLTYGMWRAEHDAAVPLPPPIRQTAPKKPKHAEANIPPRKCLYCGKVIVYAMRASRKYCDAVCSARYRQRKFTAEHRKESAK